jgi:alpha-tubulin suppressor-like RCC1 family protein
MRPRRIIALLGLLASAGACAFPNVQIVATPSTLVVFPGQESTVAIASREPVCNPEDPLPCPDITGRVFTYILQNLPHGISYTIDTSLQSPSTPGLVRITFNTSQDVAPSLYEVAIHAVLDGRSFGVLSYPIRVLAPHTGLTATPAGIVAGKHYSMAVLADGALMAWGANEFGQLGTGDLTRRVVPTPVPNLTDVVAAAAGAEHVLALTRDGRVWAWGGNRSGQLGRAPASDTEVVTSPIAVDGPQAIRAIAAGRDHSLAADDDGLVWTWGNFGYDDSIRDAPPTLVPNLPPVRRVAAAWRQSFAVDFNGGVWRWGFFRNVTITPHQVAGLSDIQDIVTDGTTHLALDSSGRVWGWGRNSNELLGPGPDAEISTPVRIGGLDNVRSIAIGNDAAAAVLQDGTVFAWGDFISPPPTAGLAGVRAVAMGNGHLIALLECGAIWTSGLNWEGQLGDGTTDPRDGGPQPVPGIGDDAACPRVALRVPMVNVVRAGDPVTVQPGSLERGSSEYVGLYDRGTQVTLTADPVLVVDGNLGRQRWIFDRWDLDCSGITGSTSVVLDRSKRCAAVYHEEHASLFLLTVHTQGGRVTSSFGGVGGPTSIDCPEECSGVFRSGEIVTLQALDANGFNFTHWAGDCSGTSRETTVTMDQARSCTANFRRFTLAVSVVGSGVVSRDGSFDQCAGTCTFTPAEETATLRATPAEGWQFDGWGGDCAGTSVVTTVDMSADRACVARFVRRAGFFFLTVEVLGLGSVTSEPPGVECATTCVFVLPAGSVFDLTAHGTSQTILSAWFDDCANNAVTVNRVVMDRDKHCGVFFIDRPAFPIAQMSWMPAGPRVGQITTFDGNSSYLFVPLTGAHDFSGITRWSWDFGNDGSFEASGGRTAAAITQHVFQTTGSHFVRLQVEGGPIFATDDEVQEVTVLAPTAPLFQLTTGKAGAGQGTIASDPPGLLRCDELCPGPTPVVFEAGSMVTLVAAPAPGSQFAGWSGCDAVNGERCSVTLNTHRVVTATFTPVVSTFTLSVTVITNAVTQNASVRAVAPPSNTINCFLFGGPVCSQSFNAGTLVTLRPSDLVLESGWLAVWTGCDVVTPGLSICEVTLTSNRQVTLTVMPR